MLSTQVPRLDPARRRQQEPASKASRAPSAKVMAAATSPSGAAATRMDSRRAGPRRGGAFWVLIAVLAVLNLAGLVMVLSASSIVSLEQFGTPWHFFARQLLWLAIGTAGFFVALKVPHERWRRLAKPALLATLAMLLAVLVPHIGVSSGGASRWLGFSQLQVQPSEVAKLVLIVFAADVLDRRAAPPRSARGCLTGWRYQMTPVLSVFAIMALLVIKQPDMGTMLVLASITVAMVFTAGIPLKPLAGLLGTGGLFTLGLAVAAPYRWRRLTSFLHPFKDATSSGYQSVQGLLALSHGGLLGDGLGSSIASYGYLPNAQTDFIFAVLGEETGLVGGLLVGGLFITLALVGTRIACRARSRYSALLAAGITAWLVSQAVINIGAVVGVFPVTGVPLPFVSFGGSSLVLELFGAGMLANVALGQP